MQSGTYHVSFYAAVLVASGAADVAAGLGVWRRRGAPGRNSLCVVMVATAVWCFAYALELAAPGTGERELWGALKYVGITVLPGGGVGVPICSVNRAADRARSPGRPRNASPHSLLPAGATAGDSNCQRGSALL